MTGTNCDLFTHNQSRSYLNHLVLYTYIACLVNYEIMYEVLQPGNSKRQYIFSFDKRGDCLDQQSQQLFKKYFFQWSASLRIIQNLNYFKCSVAKYLGSIRVQI